MPADATPSIVVLAAVIERGDRLLVTRRLKDTHLSGYWEFPGGKCQPDETHEQCLARELREELGIDAEIGAEILATAHTYADRTVVLHFRWCTLAENPTPLLGQEMRWVTRAELRSLQLPEADRALIDLLTGVSPPVP
jgi:mutator protein MutT